MGNLQLKYKNNIKTKTLKQNCLNLKSHETKTLKLQKNYSKKLTYKNRKIIITTTIIQSIRIFHKF